METKTLPKTTTERLLAVADIIEANPNRWAQYVWVDGVGPDREEADEPYKVAGKNICGTKACIAGHGVMLTPAEEVPLHMSWDDAGAKAFGFDDDLANALFEPTYEPTDLPAVLRYLATLDEPRTLRGAIDSGLRDLRGANLRKLDGKGIDLSGADLREADLSHTSFVGANLRGANLLGASLYGVLLFGADLTGAEVFDGVLRYAQVDSDTKLPEGAKP